jgi:hypothetical protein
MKILKRLLEKQDEMVRVGLRQTACCCESGNDLSTSIKRGEFLD